MPVKTSSLPNRLSSALESNPVQTLPRKPEAIAELPSIADSLSPDPSALTRKVPKTKSSGAASGAWGVFASTFATIFLAELGDKTQVATLLMSAESQSPWIVFAGAGSALVTTSLLGVLVGRWLATRVSPKTIEKSAGIVLLSLSVMLMWEVLQSF